eukprot:9282401-Alexandrium_andersonii.AAC.1
MEQRGLGGGCSGQNEPALSESPPFAGCLSGAQCTAACGRHGFGQDTPAWSCRAQDDAAADS